MWKLMGWTCTGVFITGGLWDLGRNDSAAVPPTVMGALLLGLGLLIGLRIGSESALTFVKDILRLNKFLAEQNNQLTELNHWHVKRQVESGKQTTES